MKNTEEIRVILVKEEPEKEGIAIQGIGMIGESIIKLGETIGEIMKGPKDEED